MFLILISQIMMKISILPCKPLMTSVILLLVIASSSVSAQYNVTGRVDVHDSSTVVINVRLKDLHDSLNMRTVQTDADRRFKFNNLPNGEYHLQVSYIGYRDFDQVIFLSNSDVSIGVVKLEPTDQLIEQIEVIRRKPQFVQKIDRISYNVQGTPIGISGTAIEVLQRIPGVEISPDGNSISINGKNEIGVLMDDKLVRIPISSLLQILSSTNAQDIESIEVIENPPAQYDAEFSGGMINIKKLKRSTPGLSGNILLGVGYGDGDKEKGGLNLGYQKNRMTLYGDFNYDRNNTPRTFVNSNIQSFNEGSIYSHTSTYREPIITGYTGRFGVDFNLSQALTTSAVANVFRSKFVQTTNGQNLQTGLTQRSINLLSDEDSRRDLASINFNTNWKADSVNTISIDLDYLYYYNTAPTSYENVYQNENLAEKFNVFKETPVNVYGAHLQYNNRLTDHSSLTFGGKYTKSMMTNDVLVNNRIQNEWFRNDALSEYATYDEGILAFYGNMDSKVGQTIDLKLGLRYESSNHDLRIKTDNTQNVWTMREVFPTVFVGHKLNTQSNLQFSYGRRINRPTYFDLAPYILFLDPVTSYFGNINLRPGLSNVLNFSYKIKEYLIGLSYSDERNAIARSQAIFSDNENQTNILLTSLNVDKLNVSSLNTNIPVKITKSWNMQNNIQLSYIDQLMGQTKSKDFFYVLRTTQNMILPYQIRSQIFATYSSSRIFGVSTINHYQRVNISFDKEIKPWNSTIQIAYNTIFGNNYSFESSALDNYSFVSYDYEPRVFRLTFIKKFGKSIQQSSRETSVSEIKGRLE